MRDRFVWRLMTWLSLLGSRRYQGFLTTVYGLGMAEFDRQIRLIPPMYTASNVTEMRFSLPPATPEETR